MGLADSLGPSLRRLVVGQLARRRGEVRANQDFRVATQVLRLAAVFAVTLLLPIVFLALLALTSVRWEELSIGADLEDRARAATRAFQQNLGELFTRFEEGTFGRLRRRESPIEDLGELSPYLVGAFRFDPSGTLVAPFVIEDPVPVPPPTAGWNEAAEAAVALENAGDTDPQRVLAAWRRAGSFAASPARAAEAQIAVGRVLAGAGRLAEADEVLRDLYEGSASVRDERGFLVGHLVQLELARHRLVRDGAGDRETARSVLEGLVDDLLAEPWAIGRTAEATLVRRALRDLEGLSPDDWLAERRSRWSQRESQLRFAETVRGELELVYTRLPEGTFRYVGGGPDSPAVWALLQVDGSVYAFAFSAEDLGRELRARAQQASDLDLDLAFEVVPSDDVPGDVLIQRSLGPALPFVSVYATPKDPEGLAANVNRRRTVRLAVVFTAVFVSVVGALWVSRLVVLEVENARQRAEFAANVSHELRSPITQIRLKGEALLLGLVDEGEDTVQHHEAIVREAERLSRLVDDVLDFAAIERGVKRYHLRRQRLEPLVEQVVAANGPELERLGLAVELDVEEGLPDVLADRDALGQVLTNLLTNAGKYAAEGKWVGVAVRRVDDAVEVAVSDRGIGIAPDEVGKVFDDFFRSTDPRVRRTKGTGIGLAIVRYIVEAHQGTIRVASALGRGSTFTFRLPAAPADGE